MGLRGARGNRGVKGKSEWQLVFFTTLTQMAVGMFFLWGFAAILAPTPNSFTHGLYPLVLLTMVLLALALGTLSAGLHLGRPSRAIFSPTNLRSSWLSREALLGTSFGLPGLVLLLRRGFGQPFSVFDDVLVLAGTVCGLALVYGIARLYMLRTVPAWNNFGTPTTFFGTTFLLGTVAATTVGLALIFWDDGYASDTILSRLIEVSTGLIFLFAAIQSVIFVFTVLYLNNQGGVAAQSVRILSTDLQGILVWRCLTAFVGIGILVVKFFVWLPIVSFFAAFGLILVSEILGRFLFYGFYRRAGI